MPFKAKEGEKLCKYFQCKMTDTMRKQITAAAEVREVKETDLVRGYILAGLCQDLKVQIDNYKEKRTPTRSPQIMSR
jgi:DNA-binding Xre family transcriptional regulator